MKNPELQRKLGEVEAMTWSVETMRGNALPLWGGRGSRNEKKQTRFNESNNCFAVFNKYDEEEDPYQEWDERLVDSAADHGAIPLPDEEDEELIDIPEANIIKEGEPNTTNNDIYLNLHSSLANKDRERGMNDGTESIPGAKFAGNAHEGGSKETSLVRLQ